MNYYFARRKIQGPCQLYDFDLNRLFFTQYINSLYGQGGAGIPQKRGGREEAESYGGRSEENPDGTGDETQGGEEQGRDQVRD